ncbi:MAG: hypothetical protein PVJ42_10885 [bacterium]|jgi:hypothetical protein
MSSVALALVRQRVALAFSRAALLLGTALIDGGILILRATVRR